MNLWHKNKRVWRTKASVAPYRSLRKFGMLLKIINLVPHSSLLLGAFFFFFYCHWFSILPSCSWGGWGVMGALPAASRTLCHGHSGCRVCLGFSPAWCCWWLLQPMGSTRSQGNMGRISGKGRGSLWIHERQGMAKGWCSLSVAILWYFVWICKSMLEVLLSSSQDFSPKPFQRVSLPGCLLSSCEPVLCCAALLFLVQEVCIWESKIFQKLPLFLPTFLWGSCVCWKPRSGSAWSGGSRPECCCAPRELSQQGLGCSGCAHPLANQLAWVWDVVLSVDMSRWSCACSPVSPGNHCLDITLHQNKLLLFNIHLCAGLERAAKNLRLSQVLTITMVELI